jgi:RNA polymerase sigma-70 factor (ECF subfamily)
MRTSGTVSLDDFNELYEKFGPMVLRRCRHLLKDEDKALDAMQDVFVRMIERRDRMSGVCSSLFYTVATTVCLNKIRSDHVRYAPQIDDMLGDMADVRTSRHEELTDTAILLDDIFAGAKENTRYMAVLHYVDGMTLEETADELHLSVSGVRKRLSTLRKKAITYVGE